MIHRKVRTLVTSRPSWVSLSDPSPFGLVIFPQNMHSSLHLSITLVPGDSQSPFLKGSM